MEHTHLHHIDLSNHYQFITFRTHDSIDSYLDKILSKPISERKKQQEIDNYLDQSTNGTYLTNYVLNFLYDFFIKKDNDVFDLIAFCIMPNHVHLLIKPLKAVPHVMKILKGGSAFEINKILDRKGKFWSAYYFDKLIRDENHFNLVYRYIKNNPNKISCLKGERPRFYGIYN